MINMNFNFGILWPTDNIVESDLTEEERNRIDDRRKECEPCPDIIDILYWLCRKSKARNVVEIGTGHSIMPLLLACRRNGGKLFSTDISSTIDANGVINWLKLDGYLDIWTHRYGIDSIEMGRQWNGRQWDGNDRGPIDFIYLDTSHLYEQTSKEIQVWLPHLRVGGFFVFHDTSSSPDGVLPAILELLRKFSQELEFHHYPLNYGFGILMKIK